MSDFKQWWGDRQLMTGMAESEEAWDYQQARILELEAELAESIDRHQGMIDKAMEMSKELAALREAVLAAMRCYAVDGYVNWERVAALLGDKE